jgi:hypothetical protein
MKDSTLATTATEGKLNRKKHIICAAITCTLLGGFGIALYNEYAPQPVVDNAVSTKSVEATSEKTVSAQDKFNIIRQVVVDSNGTDNAAIYDLVFLDSTTLPVEYVLIQISISGNQASNPAFPSGEQCLYANNMQKVYTNLVKRLQVEPVTIGEMLVFKGLMTQDNFTKAANKVSYCESKGV